MKKKQIEKIPPIKPVFGGKKEYVAAAAVKNMGKRVLIVDFWKNKEKRPVYRIVLEKEDFGNFDFGRKKWDRKKMDNPIPQGCNMSIREDTIGNITGAEKIMKYTGTPDYMKICYAISGYQSGIQAEYANKRYRKRREQLKERCENMPELPENMEQWVSDRIGHIVFYRRHGRFVDIECSKCGAAGTYVTETKEYPEGLLERYLDTPREGMPCRCPECGCPAIYQGKGRMDRIEISMDYYVVQRYQETGAVVRYFEGRKRFSDTGEYLSDTEVMRAFFEEGKRVQKDFHKHNPYVGENFWDDCNLSGMHNIVPGYGEIYPYSEKELEGTCIQYSGMEEYYRTRHGRKKPHEYLEAYMRYPFLEMVVKMGMKKLAKNIVNHDTRYLDTEGKTPQGILKIDKAKMKVLRQYEGSRSALVILQTEHELGMDLTGETERKLIALMPDKAKLKLALKYMSAEQLINRIEKYAGYEITEDICGSAMSRIAHMEVTYLDYLMMREEAGYDLNNSILAYPRDLTAAHERMVFETEKGKLDKRIAEVNKKYENIEKQYKKWDRKYHFESGEYLIRPAQNAGEIVVEGRILHHCVGGDNYLKKHDKGESVILFLRSRNEPDMPYITIEIEGKKIRQWYGAYDKKPDEENMSAYLEEYIQTLDEKMRKAG